MAGCCEHGDELLRTAKLEEFVPLLVNSQHLTYNLLHSVRCSIVLVNCGLKGFIY